MAAKTDYDQLLKNLLLRAHDGVLALIAPGCTWLSARSAEAPARPRYADLVWEVRLPDGRRGLLHIELQTRPDARMGERLAEYAIRLWRRDHLPVYSVVIYLRPTKRVAQSPFGWAWGPQQRLYYLFEVIRLWDVPQEEVLKRADYNLWPLAGAMQGVTADSTREVAERILQVPLPRQEQSELIGFLVTLAGIHVPQSALAQAIRRNQMLEDILKQSSAAGVLADLIKPDLEAQIKAELEPQIKAELEPQIKAQIEPQIKAENTRHLVQAALQDKFGTLDEEMTSALRTADIAVLEAIISHITSESREQIRSRLGLG